MLGQEMDMAQNGNVALPVVSSTLSRQQLLFKVMLQNISTSSRKCTSTAETSGVELQL
jgi:hypothetical protein